MRNFKEDLGIVKSIILDVDGVLSSDQMALHPSGEPMRTVNIKDGYAINAAIKRGLHVAIITGATTEAIRIRYESLGVSDIYLGSKNKIDDLTKILAARNLLPEQVMYMGDDIPDYEVMQLVGMPVCPADAVPEIKAISRYISDRKGGAGCVRDVVEQVLKAQHLWMPEEALG